LSAAPDPDYVPYLVVVTDGHPNVGLDGGAASAEVDAFRIAEEVRGAGILGLVLDTERDFQDSASVTARGKLSADYVRLDDLQAGSCMTRFVLTGASDAAGRRRP